MKNLRLYSIGAICLLGGAAWLFITTTSDDKKQAAPEGSLGATKTTGAKTTSVGTVKTAATPSTQSPRAPRERPRLPLMPAGNQPKKVYKHAADDPATWSDFQAAIYAYKDEVLGPQIRKCWHTVGGSGRVGATHHYDVVDGIARPTMVALEVGGELVPDIEINKADEAIPDEDIETALACLRTAATNTEFDFVGLNGETDLNDTFTGHWGWRTPTALKERAAARALQSSRD